MKPTEFIAALGKGQLGAAYFFEGSDRFLHQECRHAVVDSMPPETRAWCLAEVEFQPGRLWHELEGTQQMPMLGGRLFLLFSDPDDFKHSLDEDFEALEAYLKSPSSFATLIFAAVEPDRRRRFIQLLEKRAAVVEMQPLKRSEAATWLTQYARRAGVEIDPTLAEEIAARFEDHPAWRDSTPAGVNLLWMRTEVEKLFTARHGAKRLEREDLAQLVSFRQEHEIGRLLDSIAERQFGAALGRLRALLASKEPETLLLWCIGDLFRQALKSGSAGGGRGLGRGAVSGGWSANPLSTFEIARRAASRYSRDELVLGMRLVRGADLAVKSSWKDSRILLEFLVWQVIAGGASEATGHGLPAFDFPAFPEAPGLS